jgi:agmatinase
MFHPPTLHFLGLTDYETSFEDAKFIIIPVPYDSTASYRPGSRNGPQNIILASRNLELFDLESKSEPYQKGIFTLSEVEPTRGNVIETLASITDITKKVLALNKIPILLGGEHTITVGSTNAFSSDVIVLTLDAHSDLRDNYLGDKYCHASVMRRIIDQGKQVIEIGVRSMCKEEFDFIQQDHITLYSMEALRQQGILQIIHELKERIAGKNVYLSIDVDVFDPSEAPGVSTPEPGGLDFFTAEKLVREICQSCYIVGCDLVEVTPIPGNTITEFLAAKILYKICGFIN